MWKRATGHHVSAGGADHVIVGVSGDMDNLPAFLRSIDPEPGGRSGNATARAPLGTPNAPREAYLDDGHLRPRLNLIFWDGQSDPVLTGKTRPGDNLYT